MTQVFRIPATRRPLRLLPLVVVACLLSGPALTQPVDSERIESMVGAMLDAGADGAALAALASADAHSAGMMEELGPERGAALREAWASAFAIERLREDVIGHVARRESALQTAEGLAWLHRPEVRRATEPMRRATGEAFDREFGTWITSLRDGDIDEARVERISLISERSGQDRVGEIVLMLAEAGVRGGHAVAPRRNRPSIDAAMARLRELGSTIEMQAVTQNQLYLYYVLRDLSLSELDAYAEALATSSGRWYVRVIGDAFIHAVDEATDRLVRQAEQATAAIR